MGIPFYYKEMTALAAKDSGLDSGFISDINKESPEYLREYYLSTSVIKEAVIAQNKAIREIADNGSCVIVGRAADYVLRDYPDTLCVFIYAPEDYRLKVVMGKYHESQEDALNNIHKVDESRAAYYKNISGKEWGNRKNYNLLIDSSIGVENTANLILQFITTKKL